MSEMTSAVQVGKKQELEDAIWNADPAKTPFLSTISTGPRVNQELVEWVAEKYGAVASTATPDNTATTTFDRVDRKKIQGYVHYFRRSYKVSKLATANNVAGAGRNELGRQRAAALAMLKRMVEQQALSSDDLAADNGTTGYTMRGVFSWLANSAQATLPVDSTLRPASTNLYTGAFSSFDEDDLCDQINSMYNETNTVLDLDLFAAYELKNLIDKFTLVHPVASTTSQPKVQYVRDDISKYGRNVEVLDISTARVRVHLASFVDYNTATGAANTYSTKSGVIINPDMWVLRDLIGLTHEDLPPDGSGARGQFERVCILACRNPQGQGYIKPGS